MIVVKFYPPWIGGVEVVAQQYANYFSAQGHKVTVLCCQSKGWKTTFEKADGVNIIRAGALKMGAMPISVSFCWRLIALEKKNDVIYFHYPFPLFDAMQWLVSAKTILVHWHSNIVRQKYLKILVAPFTKNMLKRSRIIFTSPQLKQMFDFKGVPNISKEVIPLSIADDYTENVECCDIFDIKGRAVPSDGMLFLGRLSYYKGIEVLLGALDIYFKDCDRPVIIAGSGECSQQVIDCVEQYPNLYFVSAFVSELEKKWLQSTCYCFLFPSTRNSEAFGITQIEAMAFAKPIINTNLQSGVPWVSIHEETGLTVPPGSKEDFAEAMKKLHVHSDLTESYGKSALLRVQANFLNSCVFKKIDEVIEQC